MHEMSVMTALLESVEEHARLNGAEKVLAINLVVGERSCIIDDSLQYYFDMLTPGTLAAGATLNMRHTRMTFHCGPCDSDYVRTVDFRCPGCGTVGQVTTDGTEFLIESMEIET